MSKVAIVYWSMTGNTQSMAEAIFEGAKEVNPDVELFNVSDITADTLSEYDTLILGCPAMGAEELEEGEFEPFFADLESNLNGKKVALFGSYGWGDGEWMRSWVTRSADAGAKLVSDEGLIVNETPGDEAINACKEYGKQAASL